MAPQAFIPPSSGNQDWRVIRGDSFESTDAFDLVPDPVNPLVRRTVKDHPHSAAYIMRSGENGGNDWILFDPRARNVRVNGYPVFTGMRCLEHRDEIVVGAAGRLIFSSETALAIRPFKGTGDSTKCPRCTGPLLAGQDTVKCECGTFYHEMHGGHEPRLCASYGPCLVCGQQVQPSGGVQWTPED